MMQLPALIEQIDAAPAVTEDLRSKIVLAVNDLIVHDFHQLVVLLYRVDVDERKLKRLLEDNKEADAAELIADLLIERRLKSIETKRQLKGKGNIAPDDAW